MKISELQKDFKKLKKYEKRLVGLRDKNIYNIDNDLAFDILEALSKSNEGCYVHDNLKLGINKEIFDNKDLFNELMKLLNNKPQSFFRIIIELDAGNKFQCLSILENKYEEITKFLKSDNNHVAIKNSMNKMFSLKYNNEYISLTREMLNEYPDFKDTLFKVDDSGDNKEFNFYNMISQYINSKATGVNVEKALKDREDTKSTLGDVISHSIWVAAYISSLAMGVFNNVHSSFVSLSYNPIVSPQAFAVYSIEIIALIIVATLSYKESKKEMGDRNFGIGLKSSLFVIFIAPILLTNFPKYGNILANAANTGNLILYILPIIFLISIPVFTGCILRWKGAKFSFSDTGSEKCKEAPGVNPRKNPEPGKGNVESIVSVTANELEGNQAGTDDSSANSSGNDASKFKISKADSDVDQGIGVPGF